MEIKIQIILTTEEYQELEKQCDNARDCIVANGRISGKKCDGLLEACKTEKILERFKESFESEETIEDIIRDLIYESLR